MSIVSVIMFICAILLFVACATIIIRPRKRISHLALLRKYNVLISKYGIDSKQAQKFFDKHSNSERFRTKAILMRKAERIKNNVMFSPKIEKKIKNNVTKNGKT